MSQGCAKCLTPFQIKTSTSPSQASVVVIIGGHLTLFETGERHFNNIPECCMDSCASMIYTLHSPRKQKKKKRKRKGKKFMASMKSSLAWKCDQVILKTIITIWYLFNIITKNICSDFNLNYILINFNYTFMLFLKRERKNILGVHGPGSYSAWVRCILTRGLDFVISHASTYTV